MAAYATLQSPDGIGGGWEWTQALAKSPRCQRLLAQELANAPQAVSETTPEAFTYPIGPNGKLRLTAEQEAARKKESKEWFDARQEAKRCLAAGSYDAVIVRLNSYRDRPRIDSETTGLLADAYFGKGDVNSAYALLAPLAARVQWIPVLLRTSLASAQLGEVYPKQQRYCVNIITFYCGAGARPYLPAGNSPRDIQLDSLLALCVHGNSDDFDSRLIYALKAIELSPGNPLASTIAAQILMERSRPAEALAIIEKALPKAKGDMASILSGQLRIAEGLKAALKAKG